MKLSITNKEFSYCLPKQKSHICKGCLRNILLYDTYTLELKNEKLPNWIKITERGNKKMCSHYVSKMKKEKE